MKITVWDQNKGGLPADLALKNNFAGTGAPGVTDDADDGYQAGSVWIYSGAIYFCVDPTAGAAVWVTSTSLSAPVIGVAAGYKVARGSTSVTGLTGGDITTGLTTVVGVSAVLGEDAALSGNLVTCAITGGAGHILAKVWKPTAAGDCTPILATAAKVVNWVAIGT